MRAADDKVRGSRELAHLAPLHLVVHLIETKTQRMKRSGPLDHFGQANALQGSRGVVEDLRADRKHGQNGILRILTRVDDHAGHTVASERLRSRLDLIARTQRSELCRRRLTGSAHRSLPTSASRRCTRATAMEPSPIAAAHRLMEPLRTSP